MYLWWTYSMYNSRYGYQHALPSLILFVYAAVYVRTELLDILRDVRDFLMVRKVEVRNALGALVGLYVWFNYNMGAKPWSRSLQYE